MLHMLWIVYIYLLKQRLFTCGWRELVSRSRRILGFITDHLAVAGRRFGESLLAWYPSSLGTAAGPPQSILYRCAGPARKSVVSGKSVSVSVDLGGRRIIKNKTIQHQH